MPNATPRYMQVLVFFDLPVDTKAARKHYAQFRQFLLNEGFDMLQFSVYARLVPGAAAALRLQDWVQRHVPPEGNVRCLTITEQQYARMVMMVGPRTVRETEVKAQQLLLL